MMPCSQEIDQFEFPGHEDINLVQIKQQLSKNDINGIDKVSGALSCVDLWFVGKKRGLITILQCKILITLLSIPFNESSHTEEINILNNDSFSCKLINCCLTNVFSWDETISPEIKLNNTQ